MRELLFASGGALEAADKIEVEEKGEDPAVLGFSGGDLIGFDLLGDVRRAGPLARALGRTRRDLTAAGRASSASALAAVREEITWTTRHAG